MLDILFAFCRSIFDFLQHLLFPRTLLFTDCNITVIVNDKQSNNIGEGAFSTVFRVKEERSGRPYAVKRMLLQSNENVTMAENEIKAFQRFQHKHILRMVGCQRSIEKNLNVVYLLLPYCEKGSLRGYLNEVLQGIRPQPSLKQVLSYFKLVCEALNVLHSYQPSYVHQDIKPENILLDDYFQPLLTDFGSVRKAEWALNSRNDILKVTEEAAQYSTASYRAPELYDPPKGSVLDTRTDVWAMGCLLYAWWFGYSPFESEFVNNKIKVADCTSLRILAKIPRKTIVSNDDMIIYELVEWILQVDFQRRPFLHEVIDHVNNAIGSLEPSKTIPHHHHKKGSSPISMSV